MEQPLPVQEANEEPVQENLVVESVPQQMCGGTDTAKMVMRRHVHYKFNFECEGGSESWRWTLLRW